MTNLNDDARFATALDECCVRLRRGEPLEGCLDNYPPVYRAELARLAPVTAQLDQLVREPAPDFQAALERRLLAAVAVERQARQPTAGGTPLVPAWLAGRVAAVALTVALLLMVGGLGVVSAADESLPDNPLYNVKIAREWAQLTLARDGESRVGAYASQVGARGQELAQAVQRRAPRPLVETLAMRLSGTTERMVDQALEAKARGNPRPAARALAGVRAMQMHLAQLLGQAPPAARPALRRLRLVLDEQERRLTAADTRRDQPAPAT